MRRVTTSSRACEASTADVRGYLPDACHLVRMDGATPANSRIASVPHMASARRCRRDKVRHVTIHLLTLPCRPAPTA